MEKLDYLEKQFKIDDWDGRVSFYEFDLNEEEEVISISLYNSEYEDLQTDGRNVLDILSYYPKLENINIQLRQLVLYDLNAIVNFPNLKNLYLNCTCDIENIDCLAELQQLEDITLLSTKIKNIDIFSALTNLKQISIEGGQIEDLTPLSGFKSLTGINFRNNLIRDIKSLGSNENLQFLLLDSNRLTDVSVVKNFKNLISLGLGDNKITDVSFLENLTKLNYLNLLKNSIERIQLNCENSLQYLYLQENNLKNLNFLEGHDQLKVLNISKNPIDRFFPVTQLKGLEVLFSEGIQSDDVDKNQFQSQLRYLHLPGCNLTNLNFLKNQKDIIQINLNDNSLSDVSLLGQFYNIRNILLKNNQISEAFPLIRFYELDELDLRGNEFSGKYFIRYQGCSRIFHQEKIDDYRLIDDLRREIGMYYYSIGKYDHALANYFIDNNQLFSPIRFQIYVHKFLETANDNYFHLKFYFNRIRGFFKRFENEKLSEIEKIKQEVETKINKIKSPEKLYLLDEFKSEQGKYFNFKFHLEYLEVKNYFGEYEVNFDPEIYLELAERGNVTRENIMQDLYYLKKLKHLKSPFYYYLFNGIRKCLQMNFAYTTEERAEHSRLKEILFNVDKHDIPIPNVEKHLTHPLQVRTKYDLPASYNNEAIVQREFKNENGFIVIRNFLLIGLVIIVVFYIVVKVIENLYNFLYFSQ